MKLELRTIDGGTMNATVSYGKMTDSVTVDTMLGTFVFTGTSIRQTIDMLLFLTTPPEPARGKKAA